MKYHNTSTELLLWANVPSQSWFGNFLLFFARMIIAVNTRFLLKDNLEGYGYFVKEIFQRIAKQHPEHQFYFLFDRPYHPRYIFSPNITPVILPPPARHPLLWKYWYDYRIPSVLKKIGADVFVSPDGQCSLRTNVPQCTVVDDLSIIHRPADFNRLHARYLKYYTPGFLKKAAAIATVSQFSKTDIIETYRTAPDKIDVVYSAAKNIFKPVSYEDQLATREKYTQGKAYFIYIGAIQPRKNIIHLLKAFSLFKKRQQSEMKLVLAGRLAWKNDAFIELIKTYKYREDVISTGYIPEIDLANLAGSAYALVYPSLYEGFGVPVLEGMQAQVAVLTSARTSMQEIAEDAALYFDPLNPADIADKMMLVYKDESLRNRLVERGKEIAAKYSWDRTASLLWKSMMKAGKRGDV